MTKARDNGVKSVWHRNGDRAQSRKDQQPSATEPATDLRVETHKPNEKREFNLI